MNAPCDGIPRVLAVQSSLLISVLDSKSLFPREASEQGDDSTPSSAWQTPTVPPTGWASAEGGGGLRIAIIL